MTSRSLGSLVRKVGGALGAGAAEVGDAQLLERVRSRPADGAALEALIRRHGPMVLGVCRRVLRGHAEADDAFQATFLVFLRRAGSLRRPECLAGWLFQVAYRTARKALTRAARRRGRELPLVDVPAPEPVAELVWRDLRPVFDAELDRLPERFRLPIVLCFLEGQTKRQGAHTLGWPEGTFASRLQRGRELLRERLTRRGLALSAGVFSVALFEGGAGAAVPAPLLTSTIQAASAWAAPVTAPAVALAKGVIHSMFLTQMKSAAFTLVAVTALGGGGTWAVRSWVPGSAAAADGPGQTVPEGATGPAAPKPTAAADSPLDKIPYGSRLFTNPSGGAVMADDPTAPKAQTLPAGPTAAARLAAEERAEAELRQAEASVKAAEIQLLKARAGYERVVRERQEAAPKPAPLGLVKPDAAAPANAAAMQQQINELRRLLAETERRLDHAERRQAGAPQPGAKGTETQPTPSGGGNRTQTVPGAALETVNDSGLGERIRLAAERLELSRRMAEKGYLKPAQVQAEAAELDRLKAHLDAQRRQGVSPDQTDALLRQKALDYERLAALAKQGAVSQGELAQARAALAEARIQQANDTIRREAETLVQLAQEELLRTTRLYESGAVSKPELEKARQAVEEIRRRWQNAK